MIHTYLGSYAQSNACLDLAGLVEPISFHQLDRQESAEIRFSQINDPYQKKICVTFSDKLINSHNKNMPTIGNPLSQLANAHLRRSPIDSPAFWGLQREDASCIIPPYHALPDLPFVSPSIHKFQTVSKSVHPSDR